MATGAAAEEGKILEEINKNEALLKSDKDNIYILHKLCSLCLQVKKLGKATENAIRLTEVYLSNATSVSTGMTVIHVALKVYKSDKYTGKEDLRLNLNPRRSSLLARVEEIIHALQKLDDPAVASQLLVTLAYVKTSKGMFQESLAIYSDLITAQTLDGGVEFSFIILQAACLLKHIGNNAQSIEYLEFLIDDPPVADGYTKTHVFAFLALVYEQSGSHYQVAKERIYDELLESYTAEMVANGKRPQTNLKKIDTMLAKKPLAESSEIWEMLALQAIDRCDYVYGVELLKQAAVKAPGKAKLHHLLGELYFTLNNNDQALKSAEKSFALQPNSSEVRNLLLLLAPDKWTEKMRSATNIREANAQALTQKEMQGGGSPSKNLTKNVQKVAVGGEESGSPVKAASSNNTGEHWMHKLKNRAEGAVKAGVKQVANKIVPPKDFEVSDSALEKQKRKLERRNQRLLEEKKKAEMKQKAEAAAEARRLERGYKGPVLKPVKPVLCNEGHVLLEKIMSGDPLAVSSITIYDDTIQEILDMRQATVAEIEEKERQIVLARKRTIQANKLKKKDA